MGTHIVGDVLQDVGLQRHVHVHGPHDPAQLPLPHVQHAVNLLHALAADDEPVPRLGGHGLDGGLDLGQPEEVHVAILLLVRAVLFQPEGVERLVGGGRAVDGLVGLVSAGGFSWGSGGGLGWTYEGPWRRVLGTSSGETIVRGSVGLDWFGW